MYIISLLDAMSSCAYYKILFLTSFVDILCFFCLVFVVPLCASVYMCLVVSCRGGGVASWLSFVVAYCEFVTFPLVSWVRYGS